MGRGGGIAHGSDGGLLVDGGVIWAHRVDSDLLAGRAGETANVRKVWVPF